MIGLHGLATTFWEPRSQTHADATCRAPESGAAAAIPTSQKYSSVAEAPRGPRHQAMASRWPSSQTATAKPHWDETVLRGRVIDLESDSEIEDPGHAQRLVSASHSLAALSY